MGRAGARSWVSEFIAGPWGRPTLEEPVLAAVVTEGAPSRVQQDPHTMADRHRKPLAQAAPCRPQAREPGVLGPAPPGAPKSLRKALPLLGSHFLVVTLRDWIRSVMATFFPGVEFFK